MSRKFLFLILTTAALLLGTTSKAQAWGAFHAGYTHVGYGGVQHYGTTSVYGARGSYTGYHASAYGAGGAYHVGGATAYGGYQPYTPSYSAGYAVGGYHYGTVGYGAGVYRRW